MLVAHELLHMPLTNSASSFREVPRGASGERMRKDSLIWFSAVVLAILTAGTVVFAVINFQKERQFPVPDDGAQWIERDGAVVAGRIDPGGPAEKAGIEKGDKLLAINELVLNELPKTTSRSAAVDRQIYRIGAWSKARYEV